MARSNGANILPVEVIYQFRFYPRRSSPTTRKFFTNPHPIFSAVIIALLTASLSYFVLTIRRRWLLEELESILGTREIPAHLSGVVHG